MQLGQIQYGDGDTIGRCAEFIRSNLYTPGIYSILIIGSQNLIGVVQDSFEGGGTKVNCMFCSMEGARIYSWVIVKNTGTIVSRIYYQGTAF